MILELGIKNEQTFHRRFGNDDIGLDSGYMKADNPNLIVYQVNAELPLEIDVSFMTSSKNFSIFHSSEYP